MSIRAVGAQLRHVRGVLEAHPDHNAFISRAKPRKDLEGTVTEASISPDEENHSPGANLIAIKDNIATSQLPTTCASAILQNYVSPFVAQVVRTTSSKGYEMAGKTNMDEFGMGSHSLNSFFGWVKNAASPSFDPKLGALSAGGSSGGSAVAVQSNQCLVALGTDTGGSIRLPAAYTALAGFKPSYGSISRWGVVPYANSLDTVGFIASSISHLQSLRQSLDHPDSKDPTCHDTGTRARAGRFDEPEQPDKMEFASLKIGLPVEYNIDELDSSVRNAWQIFLEALQSKGCTIVPVSLPMTKHALSTYYVIAQAEAMSNLAKYDGIRYGTRPEGSDNSGQVLYADTRGSGLGNEAKRRILLGSYTLSSEAVDNYFLKAQKVRRLVQRDFDRVFLKPNPFRDEQQFDISDLHESIPMDDKRGPSQVDFIICPTAPTLAPTIIHVRSQRAVEAYINDVFTVPASLAGLPALSVPVETIHKKKLKGHLPAGMQIIGQYYDDARLLRFAKLLEDEMMLLMGPLSKQKKETEKLRIRKSYSRNMDKSSGLKPQRVKDSTGTERENEEENEEETEEEEEQEKEGADNQTQLKIRSYVSRDNSTGQPLAGLESNYGPRIRMYPSMGNSTDQPLAGSESNPGPRIRRHCGDPNADASFTHAPNRHVLLEPYLDIEPKSGSQRIVSDSNDENLKTGYAIPNSNPRMVPSLDVNHELHKLQPKEVDDLFGSAIAMWENKQKTDGRTHSPSATTTANTSNSVDDASKDRSSGDTKASATRSHEDDAKN